MAFSQLIVQKYGGTSVGNTDKILSIATRIARLKAQGHRIVVVVSAMGHTTDELIALATKISPVPPERELDMLMTAGERVSMALLSMALHTQGIKAISFTGSQAGIITDESHTRARILEIRPQRIRKALDQNKVAIVAGFQGMSRDGKEITTLGRGGSDTTAVALAVALDADRCEVLTDVSGIYSADPRIVPNATRYTQLSLDLVHTMATHGAQVMHARSLEIMRHKSATVHHLKLWVGHSEKEQEGTMVVPESELKTEHLCDEPQVIAVTSREGLLYLRLPQDQALSVTQALAEHRILVHDLFLRPGGGLDLLLDPAESAAFLKAQNLTTSPSEPVVTVSVIGYQLQQNAQIPAQVLEILKELSIEPLGLTSGVQSVKVWLSQKTVSRQQLQLVLKTLHDKLVD